MRARGAAPLSYRDMAAAYPDLFADAAAAENGLRAERNPRNSPIEKYLIGVLRGFLSIAYRRTGSRGPAARLLYDQARVAPAAWLAERIGEVTILGDAVPVAAERGADPAAADPVEAERAAEPAAAAGAEPPAGDDPDIELAEQPVAAAVVPAATSPAAVRRCQWFTDTSGDTSRKCGEPIADGRDWCPTQPRELFLARIERPVFDGPPVVPRVGGPVIRPPNGSPPSDNGVAALSMMDKIVSHAPDSHE